LRSIAERQGTREHNPQQKSATIGIGRLERPTLVTRFFMRIVGCVEHLNLALSAVGNPPIYDKTIFPWTRSIESEWRTIRAELQTLAKRGIAGLPRACRRRIGGQQRPQVEELRTDRLWLSLL
jgi:beta-hydroxylase